MTPFGLSLLSPPISSSFVHTHSLHWFIISRAQRHPTTAPIYTIMYKLKCTLCQQRTRIVLKTTKDIIYFVVMINGGHVNRNVSKTLIINIFFSRWSLPQLCFGPSEKFLGGIDFIQQRMQGGRGENFCMWAPKDKTY